MNLKTLGSYAWRTIKFILLGLCLILPQQVFFLTSYSPPKLQSVSDKYFDMGLTFTGICTRDRYF